MKKNMGSKISIQDIDQKASDFAKANFMKQLKVHHQNLEKENEKLREQIQSDTIVYAKIRKENKELKEEIEELKEYRKIDLEELKNFEEERFSILTECVKLNNLVEKLRDAIAEPKELDDK
jgi:DNA-binding transcriptional ArsR family regulator